MIMHRVISRRFGLRTAAAWLALIVAAPAARAGIIGQCASPVAIRDAEVNVIVLPYFRSTGSVVSGRTSFHEATPERTLDGLGQQLALLVKLEILYRALSYDHWGVVLLTGSREECDSERIAEKLLSERWIRPGGRMIIVWGKLYRQDNDLYEQTFAKAYHSSQPNQAAEPVDVEVQLGGKTFRGSIGAQEFAFPPEQLSVDFINAIAYNFQRAVFLYAAPRLSATKYPLPIDEFRKCDHCPGELAFAVYGRVGDWVHVRTQGKGGERDGYLVARQDDGNTLDQRMPEISFLQGLMGYLRYAGQRELPASRPGMRVAAQALSTYARREAAAQEPEVKAMAWQLSAILEFALSRNDSPTPFDAAFRLIPYSSHARNLAAMFGLYHAYSSPGATIRPREMANDFVAAAALDPRNSLALANLENFYALLSTPEFAAKIESDSAMSSADIETELAKVRAIRKNIPLDAQQ
jgi:hypothetical protein